MPIVANLERPRYFEGRLLTADDLQSEQTYFLDRMRRQNRYLHGWGVVAGLEVKTIGLNELSIAPGLALDCAGNEIVVATPLCAKLKSSAAMQYIALQYAEIETQRALTTDSEFVFTRIREAVNIIIVDTNPCANHRGIGPGTAGCGNAHAVCIAIAKRYRNKWKIILSNRFSA